MEYGAGGRRRSMALVADGPGSAARARSVARQSDLMLALDIGVSDSLTLDDADFAGDLLFVEVARDGGGSYDVLLDRVARLANAGQPAIVAIVPELIDATVARLGDAPVRLLCGGDAADRTAEVEFALAQRGARVRQDDGGEDPLRAIGQDLGRIAERLLGLAERRLAPVPPARGGTDTVAAAPVMAADYRRMLRDRRLRDLYLGDGLFADPAWDMLLDLAAARLEKIPVAVSSLCIAAAVPPTTALRWIKALTDRGMMLRVPDPADGRRIFITLAPEITDAMAAYVHATRAG